MCRSPRGRRFPHKPLGQQRRSTLPSASSSSETGIQTCGSHGDAGTVNTHAPPVRLLWAGATRETGPNITLKDRHVQQQRRSDMAAQAAFNRSRQFQVALSMAF